jgi:hypothetical protein
MPTSFRSNRQPSIKNEEPLSSSPSKHFTLDNVDIEIDLNSANQFGIAFDNFGLEIDEDDPDAMELLFDVIQKGHRSLTCDVEIVCNLYAGKRKLATETENIYKDDFRRKDSLSVYFDKKGICKTATKIEIFCKKW